MFMKPMSCSLGCCFATHFIRSGHELLRHHKLAVMPKRRIVENSTNSVDVNQQVIIAPSRRDQGAINRKNAERKKEEQLLLRNRIKGLEKENTA
jgi:hypothetical protein